MWSLRAATLADDHDWTGRMADNGFSDGPNHAQVQAPRPPAGPDYQQVGDASTTHDLGRCTALGELAFDLRATTSARPIDGLFEDERGVDAHQVRGFVRHLICVPADGTAGEGMDDGELAAEKVRLVDGPLKRRGGSLSAVDCGSDLWHLPHRVLTWDQHHRAGTTLEDSAGDGADRRPRGAT